MYYCNNCEDFVKVDVKPHCDVCQECGSAETVSVKTKNSVIGRVTAYTLRQNVKGEGIYSGFLSSEMYNQYIAPVIMPNKIPFELNSGVRDSNDNFVFENDIVAKVIDGKMQIVFVAVVRGIANNLGCHSYSAKTDSFSSTAMASASAYLYNAEEFYVVGHVSTGVDVEEMLRLGLTIKAPEKSTCILDAETEKYCKARAKIEGKSIEEVFATVLKEQLNGKLIFKERL